MSFFGNLFGGGNNNSWPSIMFLPQQQSQKQSSTTDVKLPDWVNKASQSNYNQAVAVAPQLGEYYQGPMVAPMNQGQLSAISAIYNNAGAANPAYQNAYNTAASSVAATNPLFAQAARGTQSAMNQPGLQNIVNGLQGLGMQQAYTPMQGVGQAFSPINYAGGYKDIQNTGGFQEITSGGQFYNPINAGNGYQAINDAGQVYNPIEYGRSGFNPIDTGVFGYQSVNAGEDQTAGAQRSIQQAMRQANPAIDAAMAGTAGAAAQANQIGNVNAQNVGANSLAQTNLNPYMNPYTQNVIDSSLGVLDQQRKNALNTNADAAINARAFGGSRQAIQDAATNTQFGLQGAQLAANLNNQNFQQAQQAAQQDIATNLAAQQANQSANLQAGLANQNMGLNVANLGLGAANQMGNLGLNALAGRTSAANTLGTLGLNSNAQNLQAQQANQQAGLTNQSQILNALQANQSAGLQNKGLDINAQQANQNAALQNAQLSQNAQQANQNAFLQANAQNIGAQQQNANLALQNAQLNQAGQLANQSAGLQNKQLDLNTQQQNAALALQNKGLDIGAQQQNAGFALQNAGLNQAAQQANINAGLQGQQNAISALQSAGNLGLGLGNLGLSGAGQLANIGNTYGSLGLSGAQLMGGLTSQQQADYLNSLNNALTATGNLQNQQQNQITGAQQQLAMKQAAAVAPVNLQMQALGMSPYGQTTNSSGSSNMSGFTSQMYQPTSSNLGMSLLGGGLAGMNALGNLGTGAPGLMSMFSRLSDEDEKTNIQKLGKDPDSGIEMYAYDYKDDVKQAKKAGKPMPPKRVGPMAQDIEKFSPKSVKKVGGKRVVNLGMGMA